MRAVVHFRVESFFATIEAMRRPELAGKPVVVAKSAGATSGVVVSASAEARALGVSESMTVRHAGRLCPDAIFLPADYALYRSASAAVMDVLAGYSPLVELESLDRAWLDVTGSRDLFGGPGKIAAEASRKIGEMGYRVSVGIAASKLVAAVASGVMGHGECGMWNVECGMWNLAASVPLGQERAFLGPLSVDLLPGVGEKTAKRLFDLGVRTIGQLAAIPERLLVRQFGPAGEQLHRLALGMDHSRVRAMWPPEVINIEHTFPEALSEPAEVEEHLKLIADRLAIELREHNRLAQTVALEAGVMGHRECGMRNVECGMRNVECGMRNVECGMRNVECGMRSDNQQSTINNSHAPCPMTHDLPKPNTQHPTPAVWRLKRPVNQAPEIYFALRRLLPIQMMPGMEVIGVLVTLSDLTVGEGLQLGLLGTLERRRRLDGLVQTIRSRFGDGALIYASSLAAPGAA